MKVAIGCDHGGFALKKSIITLVSGMGNEVVDLGCDSADSVDYPIFAESVCQAVMGDDADCGILICGTGLGMSMAANRHQEIRAALCGDMFSARMSREHNNANILCLGERVTGPGLALEIVRTWLETDFAGGRHLRRIEMF